MSAVIHCLQREGCARGACWESEGFGDAGVTVVLGAGWKCFMADRHFSNERGCRSRRAGGFCDGIAGHSQASNRRARVVEAKATPDLPEAKPQLRRGVEFLARACAGAFDSISVEVHTRPAGQTTVRPAPSTRWLNVGRARLPIKWIVLGVEQF